MSIQSKSEIKNRMVKKAAELWGVSPTDIDSTFDPIVSLILSACATELSKISGDLNNSQTRITEKLGQLMTPDSSYGAQPANAIAHAFPTEATLSILPSHQLYTQKKIKNTEGEAYLKTVYFSPVKPFKLIASKIETALTGNSIISYSDQIKSIKKETLHLNLNTSLPNSTLYLGIPKNSERISLRGISLFFELNEVSNQDLFYNQLKQAKFYFNEELIDFNAGYFENSAQDRNYIKKVLSDTSKKLLSIEQQVIANYKRHYVTFTSDQYLDSKPKNSDFLNAIDLKHHENLHEFNWIKVTFPSIIPNSVLKNLYVSFNTFPVINRRLESINYQLKEFTNIFPFSTTDLFLDLKKVVNDNGKEYKPLHNDYSREKGTYILKGENTGRLDSRKAKDYLIHLLDLLKNESAAFSVFDNNFLQTNIEKLNQTLSLLENKVAEISVTKEENHYISLKPYSKKEVIFVDFWSTVGTAANLIKSNTSLKVYSGTELDAQKCYLVTPTTQGKNKLSDDERLLKYRRTLLSRERIVTKEDVKALCYEICGNKVTQVEIDKQFLTHPDYNKGKLPTLVVKLQKNNSITISEQEWKMICSSILHILEEKSSNAFPYHIELN